MSKCVAEQETMHIFTFAAEINYAWFPDRTHTLICCYGTSLKVNHLLEKYGDRSTLRNLLRQP